MALFKKPRTAKQRLNDDNLKKLYKTRFLVKKLVDILSYEFFLEEAREVEAMGKMLEASYKVQKENSYRTLTHPDELPF